MIDTYSFKRGETIAVPLDIISGTKADVTSISASLKKLPLGRRTITPGTPVAAVCEVQDRDADGDIPAGWVMVVDAAVSESLSVGTYLLDARLLIGANYIITEPVFINLAEPASV